MASGVMGIGGGAFLVPIMTEIFGIDAHIAVATSLFTIIFTSGSSLLGHHRLKGIDWTISRNLLILAIPSAIVGSYLSDVVPSDSLRTLFGIILIFASLGVYLSVRLSVEPHQDQSPIPLALTGCLGGFFSGLLGIGGAIVMVPIMILFLRVDAKRAVSSVVPVVFVSAIFGTLMHAAIGHVDLPLVAIIVLATIPGAQVGVWIFGRITSQRVKFIYAILLIIIGVKMIFT